MDTQFYYQKQYEEYSNQLLSIEKRLKIVSFLRLLFFLVFIGYIAFFTVTTHRILAIICSFVSFSIFLFLIKRSISLSKKKNLLSILCRINKDELQFLAHQYSDRYDANNMVINKHHFAGDLNILGKASLFQYINRSVTKMGVTKLISYLLYPLTEKDDILERQKEIQEICQYSEWRQRFQAQGLIHETGDIESIKNWLETEPVFLNKKAFKITVKYLPFFSFAALIAGFMTGSYFGAEFLYSIQALIILFQISKINKIHANFSNKYEILNTYAELMKMLEEQQFHSSRLLNLQSKLCGASDSAGTQLKKLANILNQLDFRLNVIAAFFLNTLYMHDLKQILHLEQWKLENKEKLDVWIDALAEFDALISFSTFAFNHPSYSYPEISNEIIIKSDNLGHPLIPQDKRVCNNFTINEEGKFVILTGANMAGKSTFLRTVGINLVLAMNGVPVCATKFVFKPLKIMTSISVKDSLFENESYFYAELLRLKMIIDALEAGEKPFIILDEILKGTNSNDKLSGSFALMRKLVHFKACGIVATHDIALGELEKELPNSIKNLSFEVSLENDKLFYDYKLQRGSCKNLNASFLMRKMGITA